MMDTFDRLKALKRERNAVVLAHYYQDPDIQDAADFLGDSLALAKRAQQTTADVIVLAGVRFMAETAKLLNPEKVVLVPDLEAGCSLSDSCSFARLVEWKVAHPDHAIVSYINTSVEVKALSDVIVTSSNAAKVLREFRKRDSRPILFAPDRYLGAWLVKETGVEMELWPGTCVVHESFVEKELIDLKRANPDAVVLAHPECAPEILRHAHVVGSTTKLINAVLDGPGKRFILASEKNLIHEMNRQVPWAEVLIAPATEGACASCAACPHMARNTPEKIVECLDALSPRIEIDPYFATDARRAVARMFELESA